MKYKVTALDIDGTLTDSRKKITAETKKSLLDYQKNGGKIILASGRPTMGIMPYAKSLKLKEYGGYILAFNGGCVIDCKTDKVMFQKTLPLEYIPEIYDIVSKYNVGINTYQNDKIIVGHIQNKYTELEAKINGMKIKYVNDFTGYVNFNVNKCLIHGEPDEILKLEKILSERYKGDLGVFKSEPFFLEVVPKGIDKAMSIDRLLKMTGVKAEECLACGDGFNDVSMIEYAGLGVAMANAAEPVKNAADCITRSNDDDGIAYILKCVCMSANLFGV